MASSDSFNRADSATLGTADTGETWTNLHTGTSWEIKSNEATCTDSVDAGDNRANIVIDTGLADCIIDVDIVNAGLSGSNPAGGVVFRATDKDNCYEVVDNFLVRFQAGVTTVLVSWAGADQISDGDHVQVRCEGTQLTVFRNGTQVATSSQSHNQTATSHGLHSNDNSSGPPPANRFDNFTVNPVDNMHVGYVAMGVA